MAGSCPASPPWLWNSRVFASSGSRRISLHPGGICGRRPEEPSQDVWENERSTGFLQFQHRGTRDSRWLIDQCKVMSLECEVATLDAPEPTDSGTAELSLFIRTSNPFNEIQLCEEGELERALHGLFRMDHQGIVPSVSIYRSLLKECTKRKALVQAKRVHAHLAGHGLESTRFLGDSVVKTLVKCGGLEDALRVFHRLPQRTVVSWTSVISGYSEAGQGREALRLYNCMQQEGVHPNTYTFVSLLRACGSLSDLEAGKCIHAEAMKYKCGSDLYVGTCLVDMYAKCHSILDAQRVFDGLFQRNVVSWTAMLTAYAQQSQPEKALQLYAKMLEEGISPNLRTFVTVLQAVAICVEKESEVMVDGRWLKLNALQQTKAIHADARRMGYESDVFAITTFISTYGKCGSITDAQNVLVGLPQQEVEPWNSMLSAYIQLEQAEKTFQLYDSMLTEWVDPNERTYVIVLQACGMLAEKDEMFAVKNRFSKVELLTKGKTIHARTHSGGYDSDVFVGNTLITMYGKCGSILDARHVFDGLSQRNVVSWNAMLSACIQQGQAELALEVYRQMQEEGVSPNDGTFVITLQGTAMFAKKEETVANGAAIKVKPLQIGKAVHAYAQRKGSISDVFVASTLVSVYGNCGSIVDAQEVFNTLSHRDVVSWNVILAVCLQHDQPQKALQLYEEMQGEGMSPDDRTFVSAFQACGLLAEMDESVDIDGQSNKTKHLERARSLHADAERKGYCSDVFVGNSLISMYGRCGSILDAQNVFDGMSRHDVVSWTAILAVNAHQGKTEQALQLYKRMQVEGVSPSEITIVCILQVCSNTGILDVCKEIHHILVSNETALGLLALTTLVHAYGRCASMGDAQAVFDTLPQPDVVSWTALIAGYARQGNCMATLQCYEEMQRMGTKPNEATFLSLLSACSHAGFIERGVEYFECMTRDHGIIPELEHYIGMVDLLGRAGLFSRVKDLLLSMPLQPNLAIWLCLLGACQKYGKVMMAKQAFDCAVILQPKDGAAYMLMSNVYADAGMVDSAREIDELRQNAGASKKPGESWIRHQQDIHTFVVGDRHHPQLGELLMSLHIKEKAVCPKYVLVQDTFDLKQI